VRAQVEGKRAESARVRIARLIAPSGSSQQETEGDPDPYFNGDPFTKGRTPRDVRDRAAARSERHSIPE
jgi:hypothetical protein